GGVAHGVDVDLHRVLEETVDQHRAFGREPALAPEAAGGGERVHRRVEALHVVDDLHGPAAEHVGGAHEHGEAEAGGDAARLLLGGRGATGRLRDAEAAAQL